MHKQKIVQKNIFENALGILVFLTLNFDLHNAVSGVTL